MSQRNLVIVIALLVVLGGIGYYVWAKKEGNLGVPGEEAVLGRGGSFLDDFFEKIRPGEKDQSNLQEYKDAKNIFSIKHPASWLVRSDQGRRLTGANLTPQELLDRYPPEEQGFVKGLVVAADESDKSPEVYFRDLVSGGYTGETEAKNLTVNGYPAYMVKGNINGVFYTVYIVAHNNRVVYFNYRTKEEESAHQKDIKKAINYESYVADFEAAIQSIRFLK